MRAQLLKLEDYLRASFWFLPSLLAAGAVALAYAAVAVDERVDERWLQDNGWLYSGGAEGASAVLQTIAGSMVTIAGVVFSMTLVALSLASSQYGPRLLRNFMRDSANQLVLGTFVAAFVYCILVLRTIRLDDGSQFVPHISVSLAVFLALVSLWVLIYFIHRVALSIQSDEIVARVGRELDVQVDRLYPERLDGTGREEEEAAPPLPDGFDREAAVVPSRGDGYLQFIDGESLLKLARDHELTFRVEQHPGSYVIADSPLVRAWPRDRATGELEDEVNKAFALGHQRTHGQDIEFAVFQLVEVAARALSPGVNEPFTAVSCIDRLGASLSRLARRRIPSPYHYDEHGALRVIARPVTFAGLVDVAFSQLRQHARSSTAVVIRLLEMISAVAPMLRRDEDRQALRRQADLIMRGAADLPEEADRKTVEGYYRIAVQLLETPQGQAATRLSA